MSKYKAQEKYRRKLKSEVIKKYGGICLRCGMEDERYLTIDHAQGLSENENKHERSGYRLYLRIKRENYPPGFQVLCYHCNTTKQ